MNTGTKVKVKCPAYKRGKTFTGEITGKKPLSPLHIAQYGQTFYVLIDGNKKTTALHESWLKEL